MRLAHTNRFNALLIDAFLSVCTLADVALQMGMRPHAVGKSFGFGKLRPKK
jgi:hypothetical protein